MAATVLYGCGDNRAGSQAACAVTPPAHLSSSALPTDSELHQLLAQATADVAPLEGSRDFRALGVRLQALNRALDARDVGGQCRALRDARSAFLKLPTDIAVAGPRNSVALVLDLTAAWVARQTR